VVYGIGDDEIWSEEPWDHVAETMGNLPDAAFIITARTAMPRLVAAVEAVLELHQPVDRGAGAQCKGCATHVTFTWWPCPIVQAITTALTGTQLEERCP
jgi:hypothetical protein